MIRDKKLEPPKPSGAHLVKLYNGVSKSKFIAALAPEVQANITSQWDVGKFQGFAGVFDEATCKTIRGSPDVEFFEPDRVGSSGFVTREDAHWGLSRLNANEWGTEPAQNQHALNYHYHYEDNILHDVDIYIVDTGVNTNHEEFQAVGGPGPGRAVFPDDAHFHFLLPDEAGIAAGNRFGVAKSLNRSAPHIQLQKANIIAVKVMQEGGFGHTQDLMNGLQWIYNRVNPDGSNPRPSVVSISMYIQFIVNPLDALVRELTEHGIHVVVCAGNEGVDAQNISPARVAEAITVGACDILNRRPFWSNYGAVVDLFAPGAVITSAWFTDNHLTVERNGTSMACPHVAGIVANLIALKGNVPAAEMHARVLTLAQDDQLTLNIGMRLVICVSVSKFAILMEGLH
ncbi:serine protease [Amanita muscaria]